MKRAIGIGTILAVALVNAGCQNIDSLMPNQAQADESDQSSSRVASKSKDNSLAGIFGDMDESQMKETFFYEQDLSAVKHVELHVDLSVCDVLFESSQKDVFSFDQKASHERLLAKVETDKKDDNMTITIKSPSEDFGGTGTGTGIGNRNSRARVVLPLGPEYEIVNDLGVGRIDLGLEGVKVSQLDSTIGVGSVLLKMDSKSEMAKVKLEVNVGDIDITLPKDRGMSLKVDLSEFTSDIDFDGDAAQNFIETADGYGYEGSDGKAVIEADLVVSVGEIRLNNIK